MIKKNTFLASTLRVRIAYEFCLFVSFFRSPTCNNTTCLLCSFFWVWTLCFILNKTIGYVYEEWS